MAKIKHERTADCVVAGYRVHKSRPDAVGSLLLGLYDDRGVLAPVGVVGAFPMARRESCSPNCSHWSRIRRPPMGWAKPEEGAGSRASARRADGTPARTSRSSRFGRSAWSRSATTTWKGSGSGTLPSSYGGARTAIPRRAGTTNSNSRSASIWPTSWPAEFPRRGRRSDACSLLPPSQETSRGTAGVACRSARNAFVFPFTEALNNTQNYVASRTLQNPLPWSNSNPRCPSPRPGIVSGWRAAPSIGLWIWNHVDLRAVGPVVVASS